MISLAATWTSSRFRQVVESSGREPTARANGIELSAF